MTTDPKAATAVPGSGAEDIASLRMAYQEVCKTYLNIDDIRLKLLGFLPLVSGAGISLLLDGNASDRLSKQYFLPIGIFGAVVTVALFIYEHVGIERCGCLIKAGRQLECRMGITDAGQFTSLPPEAKGYLYDLAAALIYSSVFGAWAGLAGLSIDMSTASWCGLIGFVAVFSISFIAKLLRKAPDRKVKGSGS